MERGPRRPDARSERFDKEYAKDDGDEIWAFPPAQPPTAAEVSARPVYVRGAMVVHKLRQAVGDEKFYALLRDWVRVHRYGNASTADFTRFADEEAGRSLAASVWNTWLYGDGKPDFPQLPVEPGELTRYAVHRSTSR